MAEMSQSMEVDPGSPVAWLKTQPQHFRFRSASDMEKAGHGRAASEGSAELCLIMVENYTGPFKLSVSLVDKFTRKQHINSLYAPVQNQWDITNTEATKEFQNSGEHQIPKLGVYRAKTDSQDSRAKKSAAAVVFCFRIVWLRNWTIEPTIFYSEPVVDTRSNALGIMHVNPDHARWIGMSEVTVLCSGSKKTTKVFIETRDGSLSWEASVLKRHKEAALVFIMPKCANFQYERGKVFVILRDGEDFSDRRPFTITEDPPILPEKKKRRMELQTDGSGPSTSQAKRFCSNPAPSGLQCDSAYDGNGKGNGNNEADDLKEILFDLAAGDIAYDKCLSTHLIRSKQMHEGEDESGYTALATAIVMANFPVVRSFLQQLPQQPSAKQLARHSFSELSLSHLHLFAFCDADRVPLDLIHLAVRAGFSPDGRDAEGNSLLHLLIRRGRLHDLQQVLADKELQSDFRPYINGTNHEGHTALHTAILGRHAGAVSALLDAGANPDLESRKSRLSPLHVAVLCAGSTEIARLLLEKGAAVNATSMEGKTALDIAVEEGNEELQKFLTERGGERLFDADDDDDDMEEEEEEEEEDEEEDRKHQLMSSGGACASEMRVPLAYDKDTVHGKLNSLKDGDLKKLLEALPAAQRKETLLKNKNVKPDLLKRFYGSPDELKDLANALHQIGK